MYRRRSTKTTPRLSFVKIRIFLAAGIFIATGRFGQSPDTLWTKTRGGSSDDKSQSVITTPDNGYLIAGYPSSFGAGYFDGWLVKLGDPGSAAERETGEHSIKGPDNLNAGVYFYCLETPVRKSTGKFVVVR